MSDKFFLDTNIFVYSFEDNSKARLARELVRKAVITGSGVVSYQVVQEFFSVAFKRFVKPMSVTEAEQYFTTIFRPILAVHSSPLLYLEALRLYGLHSLSWYDSLIVAAAIQAECNVLYSEDFQNKRRLEGLLIRNPFD
jgi:predicted nucleic acid-binding protein